jgi:hypothetical protein
MNSFTRHASWILAAAAASTLLAACGGEDDGGGASKKTGTLNVGITDAPVDFADQVVVQFSGVELKPRNGEAFSIDFPSKRLNLLELQGSRRAMLLDGETVPAGDYEWLRLKVDADPNVGGDSYVRLKAGGEECEMRIPSGEQTGLKLVRGFTIGAGATTDFTIDFDLRKSVVAPPGQRTPVGTCGGQAFLLKPALRMVDNLQVGAIGGVVDSSLVTSQCASSTAAPYPGNVYLFGPVPANGTVLPDDYDGLENDPNGADAITSAQVSPDDFSYTIGFVPVGNYVVAYTCDLDDTALDADAALPTPPETVRLTPTEGTTVTVTVNQTAVVNFTAPAS